MGKKNSDNNGVKNKIGKDRLLTIKWALKVALHINRKVFWFWVVLSVVIAVLPAIALLFNKEIISTLSGYLITHDGSLKDVVPSIIILGLILTLNGLSGRINGELLYMVMYDYYHLGLQELLMDSVQQVEIKTFMDKDFVDEYRAVLKRAGSLTDFMSASCLLISKLIGVISLLIVALQTSSLIFAIALIYILIVVFVNIKLANKARLDMITVRDVERRIDYLNNIVAVPGIAKEMRIYDTRIDMYQQWEAAYKKLDDIDYKRAYWLEIISFISGIGFYLFMAGMILYCIFRVNNGSMTVDVFLMLYILGQNLSNSIKTITVNMQDADKGLFSLERQRRFITGVPKNEETNEEIVLIAPKNPEVVFKAENVCFSYDDKNEALHDLNFEIKKGETIALVGSNGSGKSTLVKLLIDLHKPTKGKLNFYGNPYEKYQKNAIQQSIGMFFQNFYLFHASMRENVGFGDIKGIRDDKKIMIAIEKGGAGKLLEKMKNGINEWLQRDVLQDGIMLSGGEKQKVAISRSHMSDKEILIFDEPAAALDPIAEMVQFQAIQEKVTGRTAILISHRVGFARLADRIFVLDKGSLVEVGTHEELMNLDGIYANFFRQQAEWYDTGNEKDPLKQNASIDGGTTKNKGGVVYEA